MNRLEEYTEMMNMLEPIPSSACVEKAIRRKRRKDVIWRTCGSIAAVFCLFVGAINLSPAAEAACQGIPFLQVLTDLLIFRPSIRMAIENDYLQVIDLEQSKQGITASVEYLVVDQKQINIYYRLKSDRYEVLSATPDLKDTAGNRISAAISSGGLYDDNEELREITVDFMEEDVPDTLMLTLNVYDNGSSTAVAPVCESEFWEPEEPEIIAEFPFELHFDPYYTEQGTHVSLDQKVDLDGQSITITGMEIYPSHIRIHVEEDPGNTARVASLRFYLESDDGKRINTIRNGITATGDASSPYVTIYRAESNYFTDGDLIRMQITGADFLDLERKDVRVNLRTLEHDPLPEGTKIQSARETEHGWILTFGIRKTEEQHAQLLGSMYEDWNGTEYEITQFSSSMELYDENGSPVEGWEEETYYLEDLKTDEVMLHVLHNRYWNPSEPVTVELKSN